MLKNASWLLVALWLVGCAGDDPVGSDTGPPADTHTTDSHTDAALPDVQVDATVDAGVETSPECTLNEDCDGKVDLNPCESAGCINGECVAQEGPLCCSTAEDCDPAAFPEAEKECIELVCENTMCSAVITSEPCCFADSDCEGLTDACCEEAVCEDNTCVVQPLEECCAQSSECDDGDNATTDVCLDACTANGCLHHTPDCDDVVEYARKDFDTNTLQGLGVADSNPGDAIGWHLSTETSVSYPYSIHLGHPLCPLYYNGPLENCVPTGENEAVPMNVRLEMETISLDDGAKAFLGFWVRMGAKDATDGPQDALRVLIEFGDESDAAWDSLDAFGDENSTFGEWSYQVVKLNKYKEPFQIVFEMTATAKDSYQGADGAVLEGVYLDEIVVQSTCEAAGCTAKTKPCPTDGNGCTSDVCTLYSNGSGGVCAYPKVGSGKAWTKCQSCGQAPDCGDNDCYTYNCKEHICDIELAEKCCASYTLFPEATVPPVTVFEGFESGSLDGWTLDDPTEDNVTWQVKNTSAFDETHVLYFGDVEEGTYEAFDANGQAQEASATLWSTMFQINKEQYRSAVLLFWLHMSTQFDGAESPDPDNLLDTLSVNVQREDSGEVISVWNSAEALGNTTNGEYVQIAIDLSPFEKKTVRFGFTFDSGDAKKNNHGGVHIDKLALHMICGAEVCQVDTDCDDDNVCTVDTCTVGKCKNVKKADCCSKTADCDDGNACTVDKCINTKCQNTLNPDTLDQCCPANAWDENKATTFDLNLGDFTVETDKPPVTWFIDNTLSYSGEASAHFANPSTGTFHVTADAASGRLVSPEITVPGIDSGMTFVEFMFYMDTEWTEKASWQKLFSYLDELSVKVRINGVTEPEPIWVSHFVQNSTFGSWLMTRASLDAYQGQKIQLVFEFNAGDQSNNMYPGAYIDDVRFTTSCFEEADVDCLSGEECPSGGLCNLPMCSNNFECSTFVKNTPECCEPAVDEAISHDFEGANVDQGWTFDTCELNFGDVDASVKWQAAKGAQGGDIKAKEGSGFLYFGNGTDFGGKNDLGSCGIATTPPTTLTPDVPWILSFWSYMDVEKFPGCEDSGAVWVDNLEVFIVDVDDNSEDKLWSKSEMECDEYANWIKQTINLSYYAGKTVQLRFEFNSWDQAKNDGAGAGIDAIAFEKGCADED
jgi:hypothetical protein